MKQAYRILNYLLALEVVVQAAVIAWGTFGVFSYADDHGSVTHHQLESGGFTGSAGFTIHAVNGFMVVPLLALALLVVAFLAKVPGGVRLAGLLFVLVLLQAYALPALSQKWPVTGALHGANALAILAVTIVAAKRAGSTSDALAAPAY